VREEFFWEEEMKEGVNAEAGDAEKRRGKRGTLIHADETLMKRREGLTQSRPSFKEPAHGP
jgi:hypothetical protein